MQRHRRGARVATLFLLAGCGADAGFMAAKADEAGGAGTADEYDADADGAPQGDTAGEPEEEDDPALLKPASTPRFVFVANPERDTVTRIDVASLAVITVEVGERPAVVRTTPDESVAVCFNKGSDDLSIIDADTMAVDTVEVRDDFNAMDMSPDGRWVAVRFDPDAVEAGDESSEGAQSYNEVSFVQVEDRAHHPMVVGFDPSAVQFTDDSALAVVVSDAWLALVDLSSDDPEPVRVQISEDLVDPPEAEEVVLTPDGRYAFVRQFGADELVVVDLVTLDVGSVEAGLNPTDLDVLPGGTKAVAVARGSGELWLYDLADPFAAPEVVTLPGEAVFGSVAVSEDGSRSVLYSTVSGEPLFASWDPNDPQGEVAVRGLVKEVDAVSVSPAGNLVLVFHPPTSTTAGSPFDDRWAITLLDTTDWFANPLALAAEPAAHAWTDDGSAAYFVMDGQPYLESIEADTLLFREVDLKSDPVHLGTLPASRVAWVSQDHELGRISFYDPDAGTRGELVTITGFELNAGIETD